MWMGLNLQYQLWSETGTCEFLTRFCTGEYFQLRSGLKFIEMILTARLTGNQWQLKRIVDATARVVIIEYLKMHYFTAEIRSIGYHFYKNISWKPIYLNKPVAVQKGKKQSIASNGPILLQKNYYMCW